MTTESDLDKLATRLAGYKRDSISDPLSDEMYADLQAAARHLRARAFNDEHGVAHHGPPILTQREARICEAMVQWIIVARGEDKFEADVPALIERLRVIENKPSEPDACHNLYPPDYIVECREGLREAVDALARLSAPVSYGATWLPGRVDIEKSRLFWRLRSGKQPLPHRPPTAYSCPWYELIEEPDRAHWAFEAWFTNDVEGWSTEPGFKNKCSVCQCLYDIESRNGDDAVLRFGPWRFNLYKGPGPDYTAQQFNTVTKQMEKCEPIQGWWIQLITEETNRG